MTRLDNISFDYCTKCTACVPYCPVARSTHLFPGPKASGPDSERLRIKDPGLVDASLKYCSNCKRCEIACPSDVQISSIIQKAKWRYVSAKSFRMRDYILSHTDLVGRFATLANTIVNFFMRQEIIKFAMYIVLKIPNGRIFPKYEHGRFEKKIRKSNLKNNDYNDSVIYFHGCFVNYNDHSLGMDVVKVLNAIGYSVETAKEKCCGVPLIANGFLQKAKKNAHYNLRELRKLTRKDPRKIVTASSSCAYALKHEYPNFLGIDNHDLYNEIEYISKFLYDCLFEKKTPRMRSVPIRAAYHAPCHLERMGCAIYTIGLLKMIPDLELVILNSECCGIAGTYGFKKEYHEISQEIGSSLFKLIESFTPEIVITDCETCKMQIEMNTKYKVMHPVSIIAKSLER